MKLMIPKLHLNQNVFVGMHHIQGFNRLSSNCKPIIGRNYFVNMYMYKACQRLRIAWREEPKREKIK